MVFAVGHKRKPRVPMKEKAREQLPLACITSQVFPEAVEEARITAGQDESYKSKAIIFSLLQ